MKTSLGQQIKNLRNSRRVTQAELAKAVNVSVQAVSSWECGGSPGIDLLPAIADFFDITIDRLFGRDSNESSDISRLVTDAMERTNRPDKMRRAVDILWSVFKGLTGIPGASSSALAEGADSVDTECTRCRLSTEEGIAYLCADPERCSFFFMPDPREGYGSVLLSAEKYAKLFGFLGDKQAMEILLFICKRHASPFSMSFSIEHICRSLGIGHDKMQAYLRRFIEFGWLRAERAELAEGQITLYSSCLTESALAFLYYSAEFTRKFSMWHMSSITQREKPIVD